MTEPTLSSEAVEAVGQCESTLNTAIMDLAFRVAEIERKELQVDVERLRQWVHDCQAGMYINCVYCGHRYGPDDEVPATMADALKEHIEQCPQHPMSALKKERDNLARALFRIRSLTMRGKGDKQVAGIASDAVLSIDETPLFETVGAEPAEEAAQRPIRFWKSNAHSVDTQKEGDNDDSSKSSL